MIVRHYQIILGLLSLLVLCLEAFSKSPQAIVIVHSAPLFKEKDLEAPIAQFLDQGSIIPLHQVNLGRTSLIKNFGTEEDTSELNHGGFLQTLDKNGQRVYILEDHVKIFYRDFREYDSKIDSTQFDPTDYRPPEPLPKGYPLVSEKTKRASIGIGLGPNKKFNYPYNLPIKREKYNSRKGINGKYLQQVDFDSKGRFYFGASFHYFFEKSQFILTDKREAVEEHGQMAAGPLLTYDGLRTNDYRVTFMGGISFIWDRAFVDQASDDGRRFEQRIFQKFWFLPHFNLSYQLIDFFEEIDVLFQAHFQFDIPHSLSTSSPQTIPSFWNSEEEKDKISIPFGGNFSLFVGVQQSF